MKDANSWITQLQQEPSEQWKKPEGSVAKPNQAMPSKASLSESHFDRLWQRMIEAYGHKWVSNYGLTPNETWKAGLADMSTDEIKRGLIALKNFQDDDGWPPTLLQFVDLCRPRTAPAHEIYKPLAKPPRNPKVVENALQQMKRLVQGETIRDSRESNLDLSNPNSGCTCKLKPDAAGLMNQFDRSCPYCRELDELRVML